MAPPIGRNLSWHLTFDCCNCCENVSRRAAVSEGSEGSTAEAERVAGAIGCGVESIVSDAVAEGPVGWSCVVVKGSSSCNASASDCWVGWGSGVAFICAVASSNCAGMLADAETYSWGASSLVSESLSIMLLA